MLGEKYPSTCQFPLKLEAASGKQKPGKSDGWWMLGSCGTDFTFLKTISVSSYLPTLNVNMKLGAAWGKKR